LLYTPSSADPYQPKVMRAAAGLVTTIPIVPFTTSLLTQLKKTGCQFVSAMPDQGTPLSKMIWAKKKVIILGSEGEGITTTELLPDKLNQEGCFIPMADDVESLNVASSSGIIFYSLFS
ncbi:MAG: RNA methyltransferase, partial [Candidatus Margulisbacteria bacterium]|nr:RNA methyltransferase [Candidatus Margulisiibacteriota bacterium]